MICISAQQIKVHNHFTLKCLNREMDLWSVASSPLCEQHIGSKFKCCHMALKGWHICMVLGWNGQAGDQARADCEWSPSISAGTAAFEASYIGKWQGTSMHPAKHQVLRQVHRFETIKEIERSKSTLQNPRKTQTWQIILFSKYLLNTNTGVWEKRLKQSATLPMHCHSSHCSQIHTRHQA